MAILVANDGSRFVDTMAQRDAIPLERRFMGMRVTVKDATADPVFGGGVVQYLWDKVIAGWSPVWSDKKPELKFAIEDKLIVAGKVTTDHVIKDGMVWSARVLDTDGTILRDAHPLVEGKNLDIQSLDFEGKRLHYTYAYGEMTSELIEIWNAKADLGSPEFTGTPKAPTAPVETNSTQVATTAFAHALVAALPAPEAAVQEAPADGKGYVRQSEGWAELPAAPAVPVQEAPEDAKDYVRNGGVWKELTLPKVTFDTYNLKSSVSATGALAVDVAVQQAYSVTNTAAGGRSISFVNGPAGRMVTAVLVIDGATGELTWTGSNLSWSESKEIKKADLGATKTVIAFVWDGVNRWIGTKGAAY